MNSILLAGDCGEAARHVVIRLLIYHETEYCQGRIRERYYSGITLVGRIGKFDYLYVMSICGSLDTVEVEASFHSMESSTSDILGYRVMINIYILNF
jgi:hypothetical protein